MLKAQVVAGNDSQKLYFVLEPSEGPRYKVAGNTVRGTIVNEENIDNYKWRSRREKVLYERAKRLLENGGKAVVAPISYAIVSTSSSPSYSNAMESKCLNQTITINFEHSSSWEALRCDRKENEFMWHLGYIEPL